MTVDPAPPLQPADTACGDDAPVRLFTRGETTYAIVVRHTVSPAETAFLTTPDQTLQFGFIVHPAGHEIARHLHRPPVRTVRISAEVLTVRAGRCEVDVYDDDQEMIGSAALGLGDVAVLLAGGHAIRMLEDTVLAEVKQGPYPGVAEKVMF